MTLKLSSSELEQAAALLKQGELVAFPTETVYGLGAHIFQPEAIQKIFRVKGRPADNPLIAHIAKIEDVSKIASHISDEAYLLMEKFFPGPLAIVLPKHPNVPSIVSGGGDSIAFRMPSHPIAKRLIELVGVPLVAPSANLSGKPSPTCAAHVEEDFLGKIAAIIDGGTCTVGIESTVISLIDKPTLLRPGVITQQEIEDVLKQPLQTTSTKILSPGMKYRHYAPKAKVHIFYSQHEMDLHIKKTPHLKRHIAIPTPSNLYAILRSSDQDGCDEVCLHCDDATRSHAGLMNRITLSSGKK